MTDSHCEWRYGSETGIQQIVWEKDVIYKYLRRPFENYLMLHNTAHSFLVNEYLRIGWLTANCDKFLPSNKNWWKIGDFDVIDWVLILLSSTSGKWPNMALPFVDTFFSIPAETHKIGNEREINKKPRTYLFSKRNVSQIFILV